MYQRKILSRNELELQLVSKWEKNCRFNMLNQRAFEFYFFIVGIRFCSTRQETEFIFSVCLLFSCVADFSWWIINCLINNIFNDDINDYYLINNNYKIDQWCTQRNLFLNHRQIKPNFNYTFPIDLKPKEILFRSNINRKSVIIIQILFNLTQIQQ